MSRSILRGPFSTVFCLPRCFSIDLTSCNSSRGVYPSALTCAKYTVVSVWRCKNGLERSTYLADSVDKWILIHYIHGLSLIKCTRPPHFDASSGQFPTSVFNVPDTIPYIATQSYVGPTSRCLEVGARVPLFRGLSLRTRQGRIRPCHRHGCPCFLFPFIQLL